MAEEKVKYIKCPGCSLMLPEDDIMAQKAHMERFHPEIIIQRLKREGLHREAEDFARQREMPL